MKMKPTSRAQKTTISKEDWEVFANAIEGISERAAVDIKLGIVGGELRRRLGREPGPFETWDEETMNAAIGLVHDVIEYDGAASAEIAMAMYDELSALEKKIIKPAEPADIPGTGEVAKMMYGVKKSSGDVDEVARAGKRMVKTVSQDTLLKNAARDGAQFAWIPNGAETCFFCIMLASRGWQNISKVSLRKGHAEHIHNNCKCCYMIRHSDNIEIEGYDPGDYEELYYKYWCDPNQYRRDRYDEIKDERNAKRREMYAELEKDGKKVKQHKSGDKVIITDIAIDKVKRIGPSSASNEELDMIQKMNREILKISKDKNNSDEVAMAICEGIMTRGVLGDRHSVDIFSDPDMFHIIRGKDAKKRSVTLSHNHPALSYFSIDDLFIFANNPAIKTMGIVTNNGKVWYITKKENYDDLAVMKILYKNAKEHKEDEEKAVDSFLKEVYNMVKRNR